MFREFIRTLTAIIAAFLALAGAAWSLNFFFIASFCLFNSIYWLFIYSNTLYLFIISDEQSLTFDSYTIPEDDLELGQLRLLEVDNRVVVPAKSHLRIIVTSADVLHSWAVPSSGVKCDAVPGRLNQTSISVQREGVYYGQCSEICGTNHAFMRAPGKIGRLLSPLWLSRTTQGASHPRSKLLQRAAGAVWSRGARQ